MSEWVTGQPAVSGYFLKLFIHLSFILRFSDFSLATRRKVRGFGECAAVQSCSFWAADVSDRRGAAADGQLHGGGARIGGGARAA